MRYQIKSQEGFEGIPVAEISNFPWKKEGDYRPQAGAQVSFGEDGLHVKLQALEDELYATTTEQLHFVHIDSCLEFFMRPFPWASPIPPWETGGRTGCCSPWRTCWPWASAPALPGERRPCGSSPSESQTS